MADVKTDSKENQKEKTGVLGIIAKMKNKLAKPVELRILSMESAKVVDPVTQEENTRHTFTVESIPHVKGSQSMAVGDELVPLEADDVTEVIFIGELEELAEFITENPDDSFTLKTTEHLLDVTKPKLTWDKVSGDFKVALDSRVILTREKLSDFGRARSNAGRAQAAEKRVSALESFLKAKELKKAGKSAPVNPEKTS